MKRSTFAITCLFALGACTLAGAQQPTPQDKPGQKPADKPQDKGDKGKLSAADREFVMRAASSGMAEVRLGTLAREKGGSESVKRFGEHMVTDHGKANDELKKFAAGNDVTLPKDLEKKHQETMDRLGKLSSAEFDRSYIDAMVTEHQNDVRMFQDFAKSGQNAELKAWAQRTLATLESHLKMAQDLQKGGGKDKKDMEKDHKEPPKDKR